jgi:hypothetical protein
MRKLCFSLLFLLLSACAAPPCHWEKSGSTLEQQRKDAYECERDAMMLPRPAYANPVFIRYQEEFFDRCMQSKGYNKIFD